MEFFFLLLLFMFFILPLINKIDKKPSYNDLSAIVSQLEKKCPPHRWFWQEIVDKDGNKLGERMVCKDCGPLSKLLGEE